MVEKVRFYFFIVAFFTLMPIKGQNLRTYVVQRGETIDLIADKFNVSVERLEAANVGFKSFYTGLQINIPIPDSLHVSDGMSDSDIRFMENLCKYMSDCDVADKMFDAHEYKKAQKQYKYIIEKYKNVLSCEDALYANALCSYNRKKWKSAIKDLSAVVINENCSEAQRSHCEILLEKARKYRKRQLENRGAIIGKIFMTTAAVSANVLSASFGNDRCNYNSVGVVSSPNIGDMSNSEYASYINNSLGNIAVGSILQVQQQWKQEEQLVKNNYVEIYRRINGKTPNDQEIQAAYDSFVQLKVNAYRDRTAASGSKKDKENESLKDNGEHISGYKCKVCHDTHICTTCNGSGWQDGLADIHDHYGAGINKIPCGNCSDGHSKGSGICRFCKK